MSTEQANAHRVPSKRAAPHSTNLPCLPMQPATRLAMVSPSGAVPAARSSRRDAISATVSSASSMAVRRMSATGSSAPNSRAADSRSSRQQTLPWRGHQSTLLVIGTVLDFDTATFDDFRLRVDAAIVALMAAPILESDINGKISNYLRHRPSTTDSTADEAVALPEVLKSFVVQNVRVDDKATSEARAAARAAVPPSVVTLTQGQVVVQEGRCPRRRQISRPCARQV